METLRNSSPVPGHFHHGTRIKDPITEQVVELQAHSVSPPLMDIVVKLVPLRSQDGQMLHVSPSQVRTVVGKGEVIKQNRN